MADIVIRGMEMPKSCFECVTNTSLFRNLHCDELEGMSGFVGSLPHTNDRHPDCPLGSLPEGHGRLGDLETAEAILHNKTFDLAGTSAEYNALNWALRQIKALPTIVPAEGCEIE